MISILYVDDDPQLLDVGKRLLERSRDLSVFTVLSGQQAIEMIEQRSFDAIISDYEMPGMDGIELLKIIRLRQYRLPFVLFTGMSREDVVIRALNHGADSCLQKEGDANVLFMELENTVKNHVERWKAKIALEESERRYRLLVDNAQEGIYVIQKEHVVFSNSKFLKFIDKLGVDLHEVETRSIFDLIHPDDREAIRARYIRRISQKNDYNQSQFRVIDKNSSILYFQVNVINTEWNGKPATLNFLQDITKQQKLQSSVNDCKNRYCELVDSLPKTVIEADNKLFLTYINNAGVKKLGYTHEDLKRSIQITDLFIQSEKEKFKEFLSTVINKETDFSQECTALHKNGVTFPVKIYFSPIFCENEITGFRAVCVDISEEKNAKSALIQVNKHLNLMTNIIRHDILNKITALLVLLDLIKELKNDSKMLEYLTKMEHIIASIQKHIEFTHIYQEIGVKSPIWLNLKELILNTIYEIDVAKILIEINISDYHILTDQLLKNVILNLIENSIQHGDHVSKIGFTTEETGDGLRILYADDGIGIRSELKEVIFEEGFGNHTGFGLFLIREILSITEIKIKENGIFGCGARFEILIPKGYYKSLKMV